MEASPCGRGQHTTTRHSTARAPGLGGERPTRVGLCKKRPSCGLGPSGSRRIGSDAMRIQLALCGVVRGIGC